MGILEMHEGRDGNNGTDNNLHYVDKGLISRFGVDIPVFVCIEKFTNRNLCWVVRQCEVFLWP